MRKYYKTLIGEKESIEEALKSQKETLELSDIIIRDENRGYAIYKVEELEKEKEEKAYHEIIHGWRNQKYYMDFDGSGIPLEEKEKVLNNMIEGIQKGFVEIFPGVKKIPRDLICVCDSSREGKISYHIILTEFMFKNSKNVDVMHEKVLKNIADWYHKYIDYKKLAKLESSKSLRIVGSKSQKKGKEDQKVKAIISNHRFEESLITNHEEGVLYLPDITGGNPEEKGNYEGIEDIKNVEGILEKLKEQYEGFEYDGVIMNIIRFKRIRETYCELCEKNHDSDNTLYITVHKDKVIKHCRLTERFRGKKVSRVILRLAEEKEYFEDWPKYCNKTIKEFKEFIKKTIAFIINGGNSFYITKSYKDGCTVNNILKAKANTFVMMGTITNGDKVIPMSEIIKGMTSEISYRNIEFNPYLKEDKTPKDIYNIFGGFRHKYDENHFVDMSKIKLILDHIKEIWCKNDEKLNEFLLNIFAHIIQRPNKKLGIAILLKSRQGAGKSIILDIIGNYVIGENYYINTNNIEHILGKFNSIMEGKILTICDEISNYGGAHRSNDKLKSLITQEDQVIERKGVDPCKVKCYNNYIFLTNNDWVIKVEASDRRYFPIEISNEKIGNKEYFDKLSQHMNDIVGYELFHYLASRDISKFNKEEIPTTELKKELKMNSVSAPMYFLISIINNEIYEEEDNMKISIDELYKRFITFGEENGITEEKYTKIGFSRELSKIMEGIQWQIENIQRRGYKIDKKKIKEKLEEYLRMKIEDII